MSDTTYNGWSNRETWLANLWLSNEKGLYSQANDLAAEHDGNYVHQFGDALREMLEETADAISNGATSSGFVADFFGTALSNANWSEVAEMWIEDIDGLSVVDGVITSDDESEDDDA